MNNLAIGNYVLPRASKSYITKNSSLLRRAVEIGESGIFFESNLSANNIISFIRGLLDVYGLEYNELIILFDTGANKE